MIRFARCVGWGMRCVRGELGALSAGNSPRRATYFLLLRQKKVGKEKAAPLAVSPSGQPAMLGRGAALPNSLRSLRSLRSNSGSESEHEARMLRCAPAPRPALLGTARKGLKMDRAIAALGFRFYALSLWERVGVRAAPLSLITGSP